MPWDPLLAITPWRLPILYNLYSHLLFSPFDWFMSMFAQTENVCVLPTIHSRPLNSIKPLNSYIILSKNYVSHCQRNVITVLKLFFQKLTSVYSKSKQNVINSVCFWQMFKAILCYIVSLCLVSSVPGHISYKAGSLNMRRIVCH